jgi:hypothetical protein
LADTRSSRWEVDSQYSEEQVDAVLRECSVVIENSYADDYLGYCPFHGNSDTPSFSVSKTAGVYVCYNPACGARGTLVELVMRTTHSNPFTAARLIAKNKRGTTLSFEERLARELAEEVEWTPFSVRACWPGVTRISGRANAPRIICMAVTSKMRP